MTKRINPREVQPSTTDGDVFTTVGGVATWAAPAAGGGGGASYGSRIDDPTLWPADLGYNLEFDTDTATTDPLPTGWTWVNQGSSTYQQKWGAGLLTPQAGAGADDGHRIINRAMPTEATWTWTAKVATAALGANYGKFGMILRDSVSGKYVFFGVMAQASDLVGFESGNFSAPGTYSSGNGSWPWRGLASGVHFQRIIRVSSTSYHYGVSPDGVSWYRLVSAHNPTGFVTPNRIGFVINRPAGSDATAAIHWSRVTI